MSSQATPIDIQITGKLLSSIADEMGIVLQKSALSPNIKERRDFSCAIFDSEGRMLAQAAHIPVHLGAMPLTAAALLEDFSFAPGDVVITNDPFSGGTHLPDITLMRAVYADGDGGKPLFYVINRAHHADVGGVTPGSMPLARFLDEEGVIIKPSLLMKNHRVRSGFLAGLTARMRSPGERSGDLNAQLAALERGHRRLLEVIMKSDPETLRAKTSMLLRYGRRIMEDVIDRIPDGVFCFRDYLDSDGFNEEPVPIEVEVRISGTHAVLDFSASADQVVSGMNTVRSVTCSAVYYCFFCLLGEEHPINHGSLAPLEVITRKGSLLDALPGSPVAAGNVETSQRIVDTVLGALAQALPGRIPAASAGTMNNIAIGGKTADGEEFAYYETLGGGMGARPGRDGLSAVQVHMTNTLNTPVEVIEQEYPMRILEYSIRKGSGGQGRYRGGDGLCRRYRFLSPATVTLLTERRHVPPSGLHGGEHGSTGRNIFFSAASGEERELPGKAHVEAGPGDELLVMTPGGGGIFRPDHGKNRGTNACLLTTQPQECKYA